MGLMTLKRKRILEAKIGTIDDISDITEIPLVEGSVFVGDSAGEATALDAKGTTKILVGNATTLASVALSGDVTMDNAGAVTIGADKIEKLMIEDDAVDEQSMLISLPISIPIQAVLDDRGGANSDGIMVGTITHTAGADVVQEDSSDGPSFIDETVDAGNVGANDVAVPDPFDTSDALYIGFGTIFSAVVTKVGTQGVGADVAGETVWEYWNGAAWASLTEVEDSSVGFTAGTATYVTSFLPPSDWAATTVDGGSSLFFVRFRATADDVYNSTQAILDQMWVLPLAAGDGPQIPFDCVVTAIEGRALVASASNDDTEILLINLTQGTFAQFTWTGADLADATTGLSLAFAAGDKYAVQILTEDGSTEFDGVVLTAICLVG